MPPEVCFLYRIVVAIVSFLFFHMELSAVLLRSVRIVLRFARILLNLKIAFVRLPFSLLTLPIQEHFLMSSSVSFFKDLKFFSY